MSKMYFTELKSKCQYGCILFGSSRRESIPLPFPASKDTHIHSLSSGCITPTSALVLTTPSLILTFLSSSCKDPCHYIGLTEIVQENFLISRFLTCPPPTVWLSG